MLDAFNSNSFGVVALTEAINKLPYHPGIIGAMGLFEDEGVPTTSIVVEERDGVIALVPNQVRGGPAAVNLAVKRTLRNFNLLHLPMQDTVKADDVQGVRAFGSETAVDTISGRVNDKMQSMKDALGVTHEHLMMGALKGELLDADGMTSLLDLFTEFGLTQGTNDFALSVPTTKIRTICVGIARKIEAALGSGVYSGIHAMVGSTFFDDLIDHEDVRAAYERQSEGVNLRNDLRRGFTIFGVTFEEYRGTVGSVDFISKTTGIAFPTGVRGLYKMHYGPADYIETVNTMGKPFYAKQDTQKFDKGVDLEVQSNPLPIVTRPQVLQELTKS